MNKAEVFKIFFPCLFFLSSSCLFLSSAFAYRIGNIELKILGKAAEIYDDNVTFAKENKKDDYRSDVSMGFIADYNGKTRSMQFLGNILHSAYVKNSSFSNTAEDFALYFKQELSPKGYLAFSDSFLLAEEPRSFEDQFGRTENRFSYLKNNYNIEYVNELFKQADVKLRYTNEFFDFSRQDMRDSYLDKGEIETNYSLTSKTLLLGLTEYIHRRFKDGIKVRTNRFAGGIRQYFTSYSYVDLKLGQDFVKPTNRNETAGQFMSISLVNEPSDSIKAGISYLRQNGTNAYTQDILESQQFSFYCLKRLLKRLDVSVSGFFGKGKYLFSDIRDRLRGAQISFTYDLIKNAKVNLSFNYSNKDSDVSANEYTRNAVSLGLVYEF